MFYLLPLYLIHYIWWDNPQGEPSLAAGLDVAQEHEEGGEKTEWQVRVGYFFKWSESESGGAEFTKGGSFIFCIFLRRWQCFLSCWSTLQRQISFLGVLKIFANCSKLIFMFSFMQHGWAGTNYFRFFYFNAFGSFLVVCVANRRSRHELHCWRLLTFAGCEQSTWVRDVNCATGKTNEILQIRIESK